MSKNMREHFPGLGEPEDYKSKEEFIRHAEELGYRAKDTPEGVIVAKALNGTTSNDIPDEALDIAASRHAHIRPNMPLRPPEDLPEEDQRALLMVDMAIEAHITNLLKQVGRARGMERLEIVGRLIEFMGHLDQSVIPGNRVMVFNGIAPHAADIVATLEQYAGDDPETGLNPEEVEAFLNLMRGARDEQS